MPQIFAEVFTAEKLAAAQTIDCGDSVAGRFATQWIHCTAADDSATNSMASYQTNVWLYRIESGAIAGFGSLGPTQWTIKRIPTPCMIIPQVGVCREFQGQATLPREERIGWQIMSDLIARALETDWDWLVLKVLEDNVPATKLYQNLGFAFIGGAVHGYRKMVLQLR